MIKSVTSVNVSNRRVIVRAGFDVPLKKNEKTKMWEVADDNRIKGILPTLKYLVENDAKVVIISHLDRPEGWDMDKSMAPVAKRLSEISKFDVQFLPDDITKKDYSKLSHDLEKGKILFLENLRFYPGEKDDSKEFVDLLASFGDIYVNDAFSVAHRKDASIFGLAKKLQSFAGVSFVKEVESLKKVLHNPKQPLIVMLGGAKIDDKVDTLNQLGPKAHAILVGGGVGNTFLAALGYEMGKSLVSDVKAAKNLLRRFKGKIFTPIDVIVSKDLESAYAKKPEKILPNESAYDIGPETIKKYSAIIKQGQTLVWNGPFGMFENKKFANGSKALAQVFAARSKGKAYGVLGGGETVELMDQVKMTNFVDHVSTGGGAMLDFLAGKNLPGIEALER